MSFYLGFILFWFSGLRILIGSLFYNKSFVLFLEWEVFSFFSNKIIITLLFDWLRLRFMGFVLFISSMVLIYSYYYMAEDKNFTRFIFLVYLFVLSILLIIVRPNLIRILLGWDGLGLVSYCLVIYYQGVKSANAGMITVLSNRVGDVAILLGVAWLVNYGSWNFWYVQYILDSTKLWFFLVLLLAAGMTKRAQIPFSAWLPAAIAAPTPVSALVHSSTLVTAGVYLIIRFNYLLGINFFLIYIGSVTIFISGLGANFEIDLKKIIALSTLSQLGVIIFILSLGIRELAFFHLLSHALFKSLLFLCAGVYIHGAGDCQDIRLLGGVIITMPVSSLFFSCSSLSLCGFPFLSGFYSKDLILEIFIIRGINIIGGLLVVLGTFFTITYSVRLIIYLYFRNLGLKALLSVAEEAGILFPMRGLFFISVLAGSCMSWGWVPAYFVFLTFFLEVIIFRRGSIY